MVEIAPAKYKIFKVYALSVRFVLSHDYRAPDSSAFGICVLGMRGATKYRNNATTGAGGAFPLIAGAMRATPLNRGRRAC